MKTVFVSLLLGMLVASCKQASNTLPVFTQNETETEEENERTPAVPEAVEARLTGYPEGTSGEHVIKINVENVDEFQYKWGLSTEINCSSPAGYSEFKSSSSGIEIDLSELSVDRAVITVCAIGRDGSRLQEFSSQAGWIWKAEIPGGPADLELIDGDNEITGKIMAANGNMLLVARSEEPSSWRPESGREYTVGERYGDVVIVSQNMPEFTDTAVKNEETWSYSIFSMSPAKRYSSPVYKTIKLAAPEIEWVAKADIKAGQKFVAPVNNRWVCRVGEHPGRLFSNNNDPAAAVCGYAFGSEIILSNSYEVLGSNKGDPMDLVSLEDITVDQTSGALTSTFSADREIVAGVENISDKIYVCVSYTNAAKTTVQSFGKAGAHFGGGCNQYIVEGFNRVFNTNVNYRVLVKK